MFTFRRASSTSLLLYRVEFSPPLLQIMCPWYVADDGGICLLISLYVNPANVEKTLGWVRIDLRSEGFGGEPSD